jgi:hypothetical protein
MNNTIKSIEEMFHKNLEPIVPELENNSTFLPDVSTFGWLTWIILLLVILGIVIFILEKRGYQPLEKLKQFLGTTANLSSQGASEIVNAAGGTATAGLHEIQKITGSGSTPESTSNTESSLSAPNSNSLNQSLHTTTDQQHGENYIADDSSNHGKMGWCFIGEDRGFRSCEYVGVNDQCMSGDIFPTKDVCMNPNLRR